MDNRSTTRTLHFQQPDRISPQLLIVPAMALTNAAITLWNPGFSWHRNLASVALGALFGEAAWLATWGAFGPGRWWLRTLYMVAWSWLLYLSVAIIFPATTDEYALHVTDRWEYELARFVPVYVLCLQAPLLLLKGVLRLDTLHDSQPIGPTRNLRQFGILDVMIVTTIVAVSVAATKLAFVVCALSAVPAQIVILPSIAAGLLMRNAVKGTVGLLAYLAILSLALAAIFSALSSNGDFVILAINQLATMAGFAVTMHGSVMVARACGYHLRRG